MKVIGVTPAGRRQYLSVLVPHILRSRHVFDEYHLWANTTDPDDLLYMEELARAHYPFFRVIQPEIPVEGRSSIAHFFKHAREPGTIYVRFDDDICWMAPDAIERLVAFRAKTPWSFLVYANTVNSTICSHLHQRLGRIPFSTGIVGYDAFCPVGWRDGRFAAIVHECLLAAIQEQKTASYLFDQWILHSFERVSVNACAWIGEGMVVPENGDEEHWIAVECPRRLNRPNVICGTALVSHFAYYTQRPYLSGTDLLNRYQSLAPASANGEHLELTGDHSGRSR
jgi:hypothetical protein